MLARDNIIFI